MVYCELAQHAQSVLGHCGRGDSAFVVCSYKVQLIHRAKVTEELKSAESMPSRSQSSTPNAGAADGVSEEATVEHVR